MRWTKCENNDRVCRIGTRNNDKNKKAKGTKKCLIKRRFKFEDYKHFLEVTQLQMKQTN